MSALNKSTGRLHIACCFDERMALPAVALLKSLANQHVGTSLLVHILHSKLDIDLQILKADLETEWFALKFYEAKRDCNELNNDTTMQATFYRLELFDLLKDEQRCLYLDADTLVRGNLSELYNIDLGTKLLAASIDYAVEYYVEDIRYNSKLYNKSKYINDILKMNSQ